MGSCLGSHRSRDQPRYGSSHYPAVGKNQPLKKEHPKWKSDIPLTEGQLLSKRDEFWDTAPVFEGRREIWDALKAAAAALEAGDNNLAQAIIEGANITLPHGTLLDCYDELGAHYQLPVYCLSPPVNLINDEQVSPIVSSIEMQDIHEKDQSAIPIRVRLTTENEVWVKVLPNDYISFAKKRLELQENLQTSGQLWIFAGKVLTDTLTVQQCKLEKGFVVQCVLKPSPPDT
uniref:Ubiquitin domain-containing protein 1 n=1 Tax=Phallusia mammillata TaxID=59560 RepID=A0A6F9DX81_9ASCI|nr:ubiquitin domain-containing protein 1 [Phallusia mammillata]